MGGATACMQYIEWRWRALGASLGVGWAGRGTLAPATPRDGAPDETARASYLAGCPARPGRPISVPLQQFNAPSRPVPSLWPVGGLPVTPGQLPRRTGGGLAGTPGDRTGVRYGGGVGAWMGWGWAGCFCCLWWPTTHPLVHPIRTPHHTSPAPHARGAGLASLCCAWRALNARAALLVAGRCRAACRW